MIAARCAKHQRVDCASCTRSADAFAITAVNPYAEPEGADVRGDAHAGETGYWDSVTTRDHSTPRLDWALDIFIIVWLIDVIVAMIMLITTFTGSSK